MTLHEISRRLRLTRRTGCAELSACGIPERSFRRWLAGGTPLFAARQLLLLAARVAAAGELPVLEAEVAGLRLVILCEADYRALAAARPAPVSAGRPRLSTHSAN